MINYCQLESRNHMNKILVLLSTYNGEDYIKAQLDSIISQSVQADMLVRDDGSSDHTIDILKDYEKRYPQIRMIEGKNVGVVNSFFALLKEAKGYEYYAFSDQDDVWMEDKLECAIMRLDQMDNTKPALYASCSLLVDNDLKGEDTTQINRRGLSFYNVIIQNIMPGHAQVFNQKLADLINQTQIDTSKVVVHDFWLSLVGITFGTAYFDNTPHTYYRQHGNNEIGYGHGPFGWFTERIRRIVHAKAKDITLQDQLFYKTFKERLNKEQCTELECLLFSQRNVFTRTRYLLHAKVYRQRKIETMLFYILYLFGGYKVKS